MQWIYVLCLCFSIIGGVAATFRIPAPQCSYLNDGTSYGTNPGEVCRCSGGRVTHKRNFNQSCMDCADQYKLDDKTLTCILCGDDENCGRSVEDKCKKCHTKDLRIRIAERGITTDSLAKFTSSSAVASSTKSPDPPTTQTMTSTENTRVISTESPTTAQSGDVASLTDSTHDTNATDDPVFPLYILFIIVSLLAFAIFVFAIWKLCRKDINKFFKKKKNLAEKDPLNKSIDVV